MHGDVLIVSLFGWMRSALGSKGIDSIADTRWLCVPLKPAEPFKVIIVNPSDIALRKWY